MPERRRGGRAKPGGPARHRRDAADAPPPARRAQPGAFWSGTIAFGLVAIRVSLFLAVRSGGVSLRMVSDEGTPLRRRYFCTLDDQPLDADDLVRGYEVEKGRFVTVEDGELEALAPEKSQEIDLKRFVPRDDLDPVYFERAYFLVPDGGATKAYRLLAHVMEATGRAGIATFVMRGKEYLVAIIGERGLLRAETLRFHDTVRTPATVGLPEPGDADPRKVAAIKRAIESIAAETLDREALLDPGRAALEDLVRAKLEAGKGMVAPDRDSGGSAAEDEEEGGAEVVDLMKVLKERLAREQSEGSRKGPGHGNGRGCVGPGRERSSGDLAQLSRSELYAKAQSRGIEGRSGMSKAQLLRALRKAG